MRIVADTNLRIASIFWSGAPYKIVQQAIDGILLYAEIVNTDVRIDVVRDPKDNHIVACAITAKADSIIIRDKDLLILREHAGIKMLTPEKFLALFE